MHNSRMVDLRRVDCGGRALYRRVLRLILIASAGVLSLTLSAPASRPIQAECVSLGCRLYLPLVGGRHRLDMSEYGPAGPSWRRLGPTDRIRDMAYDQRGHLWTATEGGLVEWPPAPAVPIHHSLQAIRLVAVDASGAVWFGGDAGRAGESLHRLAPDGALRTFGPAQGLPGGPLADLVTDDAGQVFAAWRGWYDGVSVTGGGLSRIDASGVVRSWRQEEGLKQRDVALLAPDGHGGVWFAQEDAEGRPLPGLGLLSASRGLLTEMAMPEDLRDLPVVGLESGGGARILAIFTVQEEPQAAAGSDAAKAVDQVTVVNPRAAFDPATASDPAAAARARRGLGVTVLSERDDKGVWTARDLPLDAADAQRLRPQGFDRGPRRAVTDSSGTLWVVLDGIVAAISPKGRLRFRPTTRTPEDPTLSFALADRLVEGMALAAVPGGGLALASADQPGWMRVDAAPGPALALLRDPAAVPVHPEALSRDAAGAMVVFGGENRDRGAWRLALGRSAWERLGAPPPAPTIAQPFPDTPSVGPVHVTPDGVYWIADGSNLLRVTPDRRGRTVFRPADGLTGGTILCFATGVDGSLWVGTSRGLVQRDHGGHWVRHELPGMPAVTDRPIRGLAVAPNGDVWLALSFDADASAEDEPVDRAMEGGVVRLRPGQGGDFWSSGPIYGIPEGFGLGQWTIAVAADGSIWTGGDGGIVRRDSAGGWLPMNHEAGLELFEPVGDIVIDARGDVWVASRRGGVLRHEPAKDRWTDYRSERTVNGDVLAIVADGIGGVWFGLAHSDDDSFIPHGGATLVRRDPAGKWQAVSMPAAAGAGARTGGNNSVISLALTPDGSVVQTTFGDHLLLCGRAGVGTWMPQDRLPPASAGLPMCTASDGTLWALPSEGLAGHRDGQGWRIEHTADGLPSPSFTRIACAPDGSVWLGNAPLSFDLQRQGVAPSGPVRRLPDGRWQDLRLELGLGVEGVGAMAVAPDGTVAMATVRPWMPGERPALGTGLLIRRPDGSRRRLSKDQLPAEDVRALVFGPDGTLWMASERGVLSLSSPEGEVALQPSTGLPSTDVVGLAWARGGLWAATVAGAAERLPGGRWRPYDRGDGLADNDLRSMVAGPGGELWFLDGTGGISILEP